jgi:hypothetical protein
MFPARRMQQIASGVFSLGKSAMTNIASLHTATIRRNASDDVQLPAPM